MVNKTLMIALFTGTTLLSVACTDDDAKLEEPVQAEAKQPEKHEFEVDKETGKIEFKAEIVYFEFDRATLTQQGMDSVPG